VCVCVCLWWCVVRGAWCVCGVWCVLCVVVRGVVCGAWCVVCGVGGGVPFPRVATQTGIKKQLRVHK
jgi:hypothetical protein